MNNKKLVNLLMKTILFSLLMLFLIGMSFICDNHYLFGSSDTQLSINSFQRVYHSLFSWSITPNAFQSVVFPSFVPSILGAVFELLGSPMTSVLSALVLFSAIVYFCYKIIIEILGFQNYSFRWLIFVISLFSIANEMMRTWLISNLTIIWGLLFLIISLYYFFKFKNNLENKLYLFLLSIAYLLVSIDFHALLLSIIFIYSFLVAEIYTKSILSKVRISIWLSFKNIAIISAIFMLLNSYWIFNNIHSVFAGNSAYTKYSGNTSQADGVLDFISTYLTSPSLNFILSSKGDWTREFYLTSFQLYDLGISFVFVSLAVASIFFVKKEKNKKRQIQIITLWILYIAFLTLSLGPNNPTGIFGLFWNYVPGFKLFRDYSKFNRLILLILIVFASYSAINILDYLKEKKLRIIICSFIVVIIMAKFIPYFFLYPLYKPFKIPDYYYQINEYLARKKIDSKVQIMPVISWMQAYEWSNQNYDMQEPLKYFAPKPIFFNDVAYDESYDDKLNRRLQKYLIGDDKLFLSYANARGVGFLVARTDLSRVFLGKKKTDVNFIGQEEIVNAAEKSGFLGNKNEIGKLFIYELNKNQFLPHFYTPQKCLISGRPIEDLSEILSGDDWQARSAVFFTEQNKRKEDVLKQLQSDKEIMPVLEFKKINPTKYRVRVHGANGVFPLVFSESFNDGWKSYLVASEWDSLPNGQTGRRSLSVEMAGGNDKLANYKMFDGNQKDQASVDEIKDYIQNGWVSTLGEHENKSGFFLGAGEKEKTIEHKKWVDGKEQTDYMEKYNIDFVSKNFQGTIQNDNLPDGNIFETWFKKPIENNANHLMANGYANSWAMDTGKICCNSNVKCFKNPDGSYDYEMVVEFWPQRLFYVGLAISGITLLACLGYLSYDWQRRRPRSTAVSKRV